MRLIFSVTIANVLVSDNLKSSAKKFVSNIIASSFIVLLATKDLVCPKYYCKKTLLNLLFEIKCGVNEVFVYAVTTFLKNYIIRFV